MKNNNSIRINKAIAGAGICSRRAADALILRGAVRVNGREVREPGLMLGPGDCLEVEGRKVSFGSASAAHPFAYLVLHKPAQVVCTAHDPEGRSSVLDFLPAAYAGRRLFPVGRLDYFSEGLLLLTDDGALTQRLTHPRYHLPKYYEVRLRIAAGGIPETALEAMRRGMTLAEGEKLAPVKVERLARGQGSETLGLTLHQGVNRQIRRMCRDLGLTILRLQRVGQGPLKLGDLNPGRCRELCPEEIRALYAAAGLMRNGLEKE